MVSKIKTTVVSFAEYTDYDFQVPSTWFVQDAMQNYVYFHTSSRVKAQEAVDEMYGAGKYTVIASRLQKTKSKLESGGMSVVATATRARPSSRPPK